MVERGDGLGLALEPREPVRILRYVRRQDLDRHVAPKARVLRAIDLAHAACSKAVENLVRSKTSAGGEWHGCGGGFGSYTLDTGGNTTRATYERIRSRALGTRH